MVAAQHRVVPLTEREGWSVLAFGRLRMVTDPDELAIAEELPPRPWARGDRPHYLRMDIDRLTGRRLR